ncbi:hypothetical protein MZK49_07020 [Ensifer sesbaniae]|uniref:hypothetical protein n=1 Tax=Ensifer sesbaniae TaxID=1214071 RepID=UPI0020019A99|nr:hypothetical protein [Ensifer sesbaniae]
MSAVINILKQQNHLLSAQVEEMATQVDNLKQSLVTALNKLNEYEPDFVKKFLTPDAPVADAADTSPMTPAN